MTEVITLSEATTAAVKENEPERIDVVQYVDGNFLSLEQSLVHLFRTEGVDYGDDDICSIIEAVLWVTPEYLAARECGTEAVEQVTRAIGYDAIEEAIEKVMPRVVVTLFRDRDPALAEQCGDEKLLALAKGCLDLGHTSPRRAVEAIEATLAILQS